MLNKHVLIPILKKKVDVLVTLKNLLSMILKKRLKKLQERVQERSKKTRRVNRKYGDYNRADEGSMETEKSTDIEEVLHEKSWHFPPFSNEKDRLEDVMDQDEGLNDYFEDFIDLEDDVGGSSKSMMRELRRQGEVI